MASVSEDTTTDLLVERRDGDGDPPERLYRKVYTELRRRAQQQRQQWKGPPTLRTTALVHEAYLKLIDQEEQSWESRSHFFAVASRAMRHILINRAERRRAQKRGGEATVLSLEALRESLGQEQATAAERSEVLVLLDTALRRFEDEHARAAKVVECRFFSGMTIEETAEALGVSDSTVSRDWRLARTWLYREMKRIHEAGSSPDAPSES
jgi:RNA polymerase sigma factor (TIGR02999 family)